MESTRICPLILFQEWAGLELDRWRRLEGKELIHSSRGICLVKSVTPGPGGAIRILMQSGSVFDLTGLRFFVNNGAYRELSEVLFRETDVTKIQASVLAKEQSRKTAINNLELKVQERRREAERGAAARRQQQILREKLHQAEAIARQERLNQELEDRAERERVERRRQQEFLKRVKECCPEFWNIPDQIAAVVVDCLLKLPEADVLAAVSSLGGASSQTDVERIVKSVERSKQSTYRLFSALWYFQEWLDTRKLWFMASCSGDSRKINSQLAIEFTDLVREDIAARPNLSEARAVMTSRSAAYCDLGQLERAEKLVAYVLSQFGGDYRALRVQGRVRFHLGDFQGGAESFARAAQIDPSGGNSEVEGALRQLDGPQREQAIAALRARDPAAFAWLSAPVRRISDLRRT